MNTTEVTGEKKYSVEDYFESIVMFVVALLLM